MKIKTKLLLGFGLLFLVVVFFGIVSVYYIEDISEYSKVTVENNYETLTYTRDMRAVLDGNDLPLPEKAAETFGNALKKQENNITEPGERLATAGVRKGFGELISPAVTLDGKQEAEKSIRVQLKIIEKLNMDAIIAKNNHIHATVSKATLYLGGIVFITFLILFVFIINFPGFILKPLNEFIDGVHEIARKNYDVRLKFKTSDEFAGLATEFNAMADNLSEIENQNLTKVLSVENQLKILIEETPGAVIGLNEKQEILFVNSMARKVLKIDGKPVNGQPIHKVVKSNNLLKTILESGDNGEALKVSLDGKVSHFEIKSFEIVVPNLKPKPLETLQFAGYPAGMIYILKNIGHEEHDAVKSI